MLSKAAPSRSFEATEIITFYIVNEQKLFLRLAITSLYVSNKVLLRRFVVAIGVINAQSFIKMTVDFWTKHALL